jgi:peptide/nickel transport system substrate-binding protein
MGLVADSNGLRVHTTFIPMPYGEAYRRFGEYLKLSLGKVGIAVTIETIDVGTWVKRMGDGDYQMVANGVFQYGDPAIGVARTYLSTNIRKGVAFTNTSQYRNPKVDELFLKAATVPDQERQALYSEIQRILVEDVPVAWIVDAQQPVYLSKRVQNANITALGAAGSYAEAWLLKK